MVSIQLFCYVNFSALCSKVLHSMRYYPISGLLPHLCSLISRVQSSSDRRAEPYRMCIKRYQVLSKADMKERTLKSGH